MKNKFYLVLTAIILLIGNMQNAFSYDSGFGEKPVSYCDTLPQDTKYNCYADVAERNGDVSICEKIIGEAWVMEKRNWCYERVSEATGDETICDRISLERYPEQEMHKKWSCILDVGVAKNDVEICDNLSNEDYRDTCYQQLGEKLNDPQICAKINLDNYVRDGCFNNVAIATNDDTLCERIANNDLKIYCLKQSTPLNSGIRSWAFVLFFILVFTLGLLGDVALIKRSKIKNKLIWIGLSGGIIVGLGTGLFAILPDIIYGGNSRIILSLVLNLLHYTTVGFLIALLISKVRHPVTFGLIAGFVFPLLVNIIIKVLPENIGFMIGGLDTLPLILLMMLFLGTPSGEGGLAYYTIAGYLSPIFYAAVGGLIGLIVLIKRKKASKSH